MDQKANREPLISVIVPVYGTEKWLRRCLDSIIWQSYRNIELICVNDASPDGCAEILDAYVKSSPRIAIKVVTHEKNKGLFTARLSGLKVATGDYIAFVDSDDYVSCDWFRPLIDKAEAESADMVLGNIVEIDEQGWKHYSNINRSLPKAVPVLEGDAIYRTFMKQRGSLFYWHVVWNKVYRKSFFDRCMPYYEAITGHLIMTEDIAFSCVLYANARKVCLEDNDCYFYCRHQEASTGSAQPLNKILKNIRDVSRVFGFFKSVLLERGIFEEVGADYEAFRDRYFRIWCNSVRAAGLLENEEVKTALLSGFSKQEFEFCTQYEFHLNSLNTTWDDRFEKMKQAICDPKIKTVSFDIFDTLLKRPLWVPEDARYFMQYRAGDLLSGGEENVFIKARTYSEKRCRELAHVKDKASEDVNLDEIYETMGEVFGFSFYVTEALKKIEIETEKELLHPRRAGAQLFALAKYCKKNVIAVSDMYLGEAVLRETLLSCGYNGLSAIYVSSEYRKLKGTGNLFRLVLGDLAQQRSERPENVLHIGDTWHNDVVVPRSLGMQAMFLPKAVDVFNGNVGDIYNGACSSFLKENHSDLFDTRKLAGDLPVRTMYAVIANDIFDMPFNAFQAESRFNGDPYLMGCFALGPYLAGVAQWILREVKKNGYEHIAFIARDGFLVKKIFDELAEKAGIPIRSSYVYATRRSVLPYTMTAKEKFFGADNFVNIHSPDHTFAKCLQIFEPVSRPMTPEMKREYALRGIMLDEPIGGADNYRQFIKAFLEISYDEDKAAKARRLAEDYYRPLFEGKSVAFDAGYSGRIQKALGELCGHPVDALFLHDNGYATNAMARAGGFNVCSFYDYDPAVTDILRETFISENAPSCIALQEKDGGVQPVFDEESRTYEETFAIDLMQKGAFAFAGQYLTYFAKYSDMLIAHNTKLGYLFEYFCKYAKDFDKYVFINYTIEDKVYSGFSQKGLVYRWNENLNETAVHGNGAVMPVSRQKTVEQMLQGKPKIVKALFYFLFDRETFKRKLKERKNRRK